MISALQRFLAPTPSSVPASRTGPHLLLAPVLVSVLVLGGCGSDDDGDSDTDPGSGGTGQNGDSIFAASAVAEERFGDVTVRVANPSVDDSTVSAVVDGLNGFSLDLHRRLADETPDGNAIGSGYSIAAAVSLLRAAAAGEVDGALANLTGVDAIAESDLHAAMNRIALDLESRSGEDLLLRGANRLFTAPGRDFTATFMDTATGQYGAPATEVNFRERTAEVMALINDWVSAQTDGLIPQLLTELSPDTVAMIVNAILLDALWETEFEKRGERAFDSLDGSTDTVETFGGVVRLPAVRSDALTAVEIPYKGGEVAMLIVQPADLESFEAALSAADLAALRERLSPSTVDITVPEWETKTRFDPQTLLAPSGFPQNLVALDDLLDDDAPGTLYELQAVHEAVIEVDELGTRAAAATAIGAVETSLPEIDLTIAIDGPFLYFLIDRPSGLVLFGGRTVAL